MRCRPKPKVQEVLRHLGWYRPRGKKWRHPRLGRRTFRLTEAVQASRRFGYQINVRGQ